MGQRIADVLDELCHEHGVTEYAVLMDAYHRADWNMEKMYKDFSSNFNCGRTRTRQYIKKMRVCLPQVSRSVGDAYLGCIDDDAFLEDMLSQCDGNIAEMARRLGARRSTISQMLARRGIATKYGKTLLFAKPSFAQKISETASQHGVTEYAVMMDVLARSNWVVKNMATTLGVSGRTVYTYMSCARMALPYPRSRCERQACREGKPLRDWLLQAGQRAGSLAAMAKELGAEGEEVRYVFIKAGLCGNQRRYVHLTDADVMIGAREACLRYGMDIKKVASKAAWRRTSCAQVVVDALAEKGIACTIGTPFGRSLEDAARLLDLSRLEAA